MPPSPHFLAPKFRGFVCKACLSRLQISQQRRLQWLSRSIITSSRRYQEQGGPRDGEYPTPNIKFFNQTPDGVRIEVQEEVQGEVTEDLINEDLDAKIRQLKEITKQPLNDIQIEDLTSMFGEEGKDSPFDSLMDEANSLNEGNDADFEKLQALTEKIKDMDLNNLSEEDRLRLRAEVLNPLSKEATSVLPAASSSTADHEAPRYNYIASIQPPSSERDGETSSNDHWPSSGDHPRVRKLKQVLNQALRPELTSRWHKIRRSKVPKGEPTLKEIWQAYMMCRTTISKASMPFWAWADLWNLVRTEGIHRMARIKYLGDDMRKMGIPMDWRQNLLYIEAIFMEADRGMAMQAWKAARPSEPENRSILADYLELGIRMFCIEDDPEAAVKLAAEIISNEEDPTRFRILLPIIQVYLKQDTIPSLHRAWALYIRMRVHLGQEMTMEDYDALTSMFLKANQPDLASGIFKDMMLTGSKTAAREDSTALYKASLGNIGNLHSIDIKKKELESWENSLTLAKLPARFNNRYFFGSWIKKLIGERELDAAQQVFNLMAERQIQPDAKHVNGLIGAWLREGNTKSQVLAESKAWKMIEERINFVKARDMQYNLEYPLRVRATTEPLAYRSLHFIPPATIETFTILIEHYRKRQKFDVMSDLFDALKKAKVQPNTYFMNELLHMDRRSHHTSWAWDTYCSLSQNNSCRPNIATFYVLWDLMKRQMDPLIGQRPDQQPRQFTTPRLLFAEMIKHKSSLIGGRGGIPEGLYNLIILSFSLAQDQAGTAVALRALHTHFGLYPSQETARTVVLQVTRQGLLNEAGYKPRRLNLASEVTKARIGMVTKVLQAFQSQRIEALSRQGINFEELQGDAKLEESLLLLSDLLRFVAQARIDAEERHQYTAEIASKTAAEQMGVPDCVTWTDQNVTVLDASRL